VENLHDEAVGTVCLSHLPDSLSGCLTDSRTLPLLFFFITMVKLQEERGVERAEAFRETVAHFLEALVEVDVRH
jgi:hypothetical protein